MLMKESIAALLLGGAASLHLVAALPQPLQRDSFTLDIRTDSELYRRLQARQSSYNPNQPDPSQPPSPAPHCVPITDSDLKGLPQDLVTSLIQFLAIGQTPSSNAPSGPSCDGDLTYLSQVNPAGCYAPSYGAYMVYQSGDDTASQQDFQHLIANHCMGYGATGKDQPYCWATISVPTLADFQNGARWLYACPGAAQFSSFATTGGGCTSSTSSATGNLTGTGGTISTTIQRSTTFDYSVTTTQDTTYAASMSFTVSEQVDVDGEIAGSKTTESLTAAVSYTYESSTGTTIDTSSTDSNSIQVSMSPNANEKCSINVEEIYCPGSVPVTVPVSFIGDIVVSQMSTGSSYGNNPVGPCQYINGPNGSPVCTKAQAASEGASAQYFFPFQNLISMVGDPNSLNLEQTISGAIHAQGAYSLTCTNLDGSPITSSSSYQPLLTCPAAFKEVNACTWTPPDYISTGGVTSDWQNWAGEKVAYSQSPAPNKQVGYGVYSVAFDAVVPANSTANSVNCTTSISVVPPFVAGFMPQESTLVSSSDASDFSSVYTTEYEGLCDRFQVGSCWISSITSQHAKTFNWTVTNTFHPGSPTQEISFSNGGNPWPLSDRLTFEVSCADMYGGFSTSDFTQTVARVAQVTVTLPGATTTTTVHQTTLPAATQVLTVSTSTVTPTSVITASPTTTIVIATSYTETVQNAQKVSTTTTIGVTRSGRAGVTTTTSTLPVPTSSYAPPGATVIVTSTLIPTIISTRTIGQRTTTVTVSSSTCTVAGVTTVVSQAAAARAAQVSPREVLLARQQYQQYTPDQAQQGTTSSVDATLTTMVTDSSDTQTLTGTSTYTSLDSLDVATATASTTLTTTTPSPIATLFEILTQYGSTRTFTRSSYTTSASTATHTALVTPPATVTTVAANPSSTATLITVFTDFANARRSTRTTRVRTATQTICVPT